MSNSDPSEVCRCGDCNRAPNRLPPIMWHEPHLRPQSTCQNENSGIAIQFLGFRLVIENKAVTSLQGKAPLQGHHAPAIWRKTVTTLWEQVSLATGRQERPWSIGKICGAESRPQVQGRRECLPLNSLEEERGSTLREAFQKDPQSMAVVPEQPKSFENLIYTFQ